MQLSISILILWILPGFSLLAALFPRKEQISLGERLAFSIPASTIVSSLVGLVLSRYFLFTAFWIIYSMLSVIIVLLTVAYFRGYRLNLSSFREIRKVFLDNRYLAGLFFFLLALIFFTISKYPLTPVYSSLGYIYQSFQIAQLQGMPGGFSEWNSLQPVIINKILFNIFTAEFIVLNNLNILALMRVIMVMIFISAVLSAMAFLRLFFAPSVTFILLVFLFIFPVLEGSFHNKISAVRGESFAYSAMFFLFWLGWRGFYGQEKQKKWLALLFLPVINLIHGVVGITSCLYLMALSWVSMFFKKKMAMKNLIWFILIPVIFLLGSEVLIKATGKTVAYAHSIKKGEYLSVNGEDPTWLFFKMVNKDGGKFRPIQPRGFYGGFEEIFKEISEPFLLFSIKDMSAMALVSLSYSYNLIKSADNINISFEQIDGSKLFKALRNDNFLWYLNLCFLVLSLVLIAWAVRITMFDNRELFHSLLVWIFFSLAIVILALLFLWRYSTYLPAFHFLRRETRFIIFLPLFLWGFILMRFNSRLSSRPLTVLKRSIIIFVIFAGAVSHIYWHSLRPSLSKAGVQALHWLKGKVPQHKAVLSNQRTTGSIGLIANTPGVLDGRAPYLQPDLLYDALNKMTAAKNFFTSGKNSEILDEERVAYVLVAPEGELGGQDITRGDYNIQMLSSHPKLKFERVFGNVVVYKVISN